jgi:tetratricopeptide (TPR) repeat protein
VGTVTRAAVAAALTLAGACAGDGDTPGFPPAPAAAEPPPPTAFAGAGACADCHADQMAAWRGSTHGRAGGAPGEVRVLAPFDGRPIRFADAVVTPFRDGARFAFRVENRATGDDTTVTVDGVIGGGHMEGGGTQGFVTRAADGTWRFLPFDWSRHGRFWFCNTQTRTDTGDWRPITAAMSLRECGDWTPARVLGDDPRFPNCQNCHGSGVALADAGAGAWRTDVRSLAIDCESCHGPARAHVDRLRRGDARGGDIGLEPLAALDKDASLAVCWSCHATKDRLADGWHPGTPLTAHYALGLPQLGPDAPLGSDGRTAGFAYQEGHRWSDCYRNGGMTCTSCHDPHTQGYRTVDGTPLPGRVDDRQCTACHASKAVEVASHTKHAAGSTGSNCVACHMPYLQQPMVGARVPYGRSDHSIASPRPAVDAAMGLVGACRQCHADRSVEALARDTDRLWGPLKPHDPAVAGLLAADTVTDAARAASVLLVVDSRHGAAQATGIARYLERFLRPGMPALAGDAERRLTALAESPDDDVAALALAARHYARGHEPATVRALALTARALGARWAAVRPRWVAALGAVGDAQREAGAGDRAVVAYRAALMIAPADPRLHRNLGLAFLGMQDPAAAAAAFEAAVARQPGDAIAWLNLGVAKEALGDAVGATAAWERALAADSGVAAAATNLANARLAGGDAAGAVPLYQRALARDPALARAHFGLALAWLQRDELTLARRSVARALFFDPRIPDGEALAGALAAAAR